VDAYSVPMVRWAVSVLPKGLTEFPHVLRHHEHMLLDASVSRTINRSVEIDGSEFAKSVSGFTMATLLP
jgi:hypothetical protein